MCHTSEPGASLLASAGFASSCGLAPARELSAVPTAFALSSLLAARAASSFAATGAGRAAWLAASFSFSRLGGSTRLAGGSGRALRLQQPLRCAFAS